MRPNNPSAVGWDCPECGRRTLANLRNGLAYAHTKHDSTDNCVASSQPVLTPISKDAPLHLGEEVKPAAPRNYRKPHLDDQRSTSVRSIGGGLPDTNRGRH